jgi:hypothetical protein
MSKYNYFNSMLIDGYSFPSSPQATFNFNSQGMSFLNRGSYTIQYSFDGTYIHGDLDPDDESKGLVFDNRLECRVWFRSIDGYSTVRVEAWGGWGRGSY